MAPSPPDTTQRKPLRLLMVGLSQDMDRISDGIWYEDYEMMAAGGRAIAEHPKIPPEQIITIKEAIDDQFQQFVQYDEDVHRTAAELAEAAAERNLSAVLEKYNRIQRGCVGCHAAFRDRVRKALR